MPESVDYWAEYPDPEDARVAIENLQALFIANRGRFTLRERVRRMKELDIEEGRVPADSDPEPTEEECRLWLAMEENVLSLRPGIGEN